MEEKKPFIVLDNERKGRDDTRKEEEHAQGKYDFIIKNIARIEDVL